MSTSSNTKQNKLISKTFGTMFFGLSVSALASYLLYATELYKVIDIWGMIVLGIIGFVVEIIFLFKFKELSPTKVRILFYTFAIIQGLFVGYGCLFYDLNTITEAFFITALLFGSLALYGYFTKKDVSKLGTICFFALGINIIVSLFNIFILKSPMIDIILNWAAVIIYSGLTIHDMNKIKSMSKRVKADDDKLHLYCALDLMLDIIGLFIEILSILDRNKKK